MSFLAVLIKHPSLSGSKTDLMHALLLEDSKGDLLLNSNVLLKLSSFLVLKNYLHFIFLLKSEMSCVNILHWLNKVSEKALFLILLSNNKVFWLKLKTQSETNEPLIRSSTNLLQVLVLPHSVSRVSKSECSRSYKSRSDSLTWDLGLVSWDWTYAGIFEGLLSHHWVVSKC